MYNMEKQAQHLKLKLNVCDKRKLRTLNLTMYKMSFNPNLYDGNPTF